MGQALGGAGGLKGQAGPGAAAHARLRGGCLLICGWEGDAAAIARRRAPAARVLRRAGAMPVGEGPGRGWLAGRYAGPHLRDDLLDRGVLVETLETATTWSNLEALKGAVTRALEGTLAAPLVALPRLPPLRDRRVALLHGARGAGRRATRSGSGSGRRRAATDAIVAAGGTITHHHAVGADHAPWMPAEVGRARARRAARAQGALRPGRGHEPRQAARRLAARSAACRRARRARAACGLAVALARDHDLLVAVASQRGNLSRSSVRGPVVPQLAVGADRLGEAEPLRGAAGRREPDGVGLVAAGFGGTLGALERERRAAAGRCRAACTPVPLAPLVPLSADLADGRGGGRGGRRRPWRTRCAVGFSSSPVEDEEDEHDDDDRDAPRARSAPRRRAVRTRRRRRSGRVRAGPAPRGCGACRAAGAGGGRARLAAGSAGRRGRGLRLGGLRLGGPGAAASRLRQLGQARRPTSASCARTVSAHSRAPLELRSSRRVAWRGLPFCWPSRKSAICASLSAGSSTSGASAESPLWARARTASSEIFRSSAICA